MEEFLITFKKIIDELEKVSKKDLQLFLTFTLDDEKCLLQLSPLLIDKITELTCFIESISLCDERRKNEKNFSLEEIRFILLENIFYKVRCGTETTKKYFEKLFILMMKNKSWISTLQSLSQKTSEQNVSTGQNNNCYNGSICNKWYKYVFSSIVSIFDKEIHRIFWDVSSRQDKDQIQGQCREIRVKFPIADDLLSIFTVDIGDKSSKSNSEFFHVTNSFYYSVQEESFVKQAYLLGRYIEPYICDLKNTEDRKNVYVHSSVTGDFNLDITDKLIESFLLGRKEWMKERNENISKLANFLNCLNFSSDFTFDKPFLIPEINLIIAKFTF